MSEQQQSNQPKYGSGTYQQPVRMGFRGPRRGPGGGRFAGLFATPEKPKNVKGTLLRLWRYLKKQKYALAVAFLLILISSTVSLLGPLLIGRGIDALSLGAGAVDFERLSTILLLMATVYLVSACATWLQNYVIVGVSQRTVHTLRTDLFEKLQRLPVRFFDSRTHGEIMSRLANDVETVSHTLTQSTTQVFNSIITVVGSITAMLTLSPVLTLVSIVTVPLGFLITRKIVRFTRSHFSAQQRELGNINGFIEEIITGQRVVKAFCREEAVLQDFDDINQSLKNASIKAQVFSGIIGPLMNVVNNLSFVLVVSIGGLLASRGLITVGVIASMVNYSRQLARPINEVANQVNMMQSAVSGAERAFEILDAEEEEADAPDAIHLTDVKGAVSFDRVSFGYVEDVPVLERVDIRAEPGQTIALVGPTGAGKTTIVNLIMRFYDVNEGAITIDGKDIRQLAKDNLRSSLGIVLQDTYLFSGTVRENIRYGRLDATDEEVEAAAKMANADGFICRLPNGYDTELASEGGNLSQGQRQLLTIARAILANPSILILDEATSSVDTRTEMHIQEAMLSLMKGRTCFVIAHRLSTIQGADEILVINHGRIIERGTHEELLAKKGFYHELYTSQFRRQLGLGNVGMEAVAAG
ncbi:MAG: ABC transporter ATP-binding protein [Limnochordia bacterium]|jgi:ATP-binding cassette subfamily B multidrug efflux pump